MDDEGIKAEDAVLIKNGKLGRALLDTTVSGIAFENGEGKYALSETMVNGNLGDIVKNIRDISKEVVCDGSSVVPYIAVDGVVISGK